MKKNKQITKKIIPSLVLFLFVFTSLQIFSISKVQAATLINDKLNWENPNKKGDNPYKITTDAILNPQTMMYVVGCTGIVDKVSVAVSNFLSKQANKAITGLAKDKTKEEACRIAKASATTGVSGLPTGTGVPEPTAIQQAIIDSGFCNDEKNVYDRYSGIKADEAVNLANITKKREECFDGLAYTLAKNQLTSMTRQTINWVNTGFNGDPMYVQNTRSFMNSIEKNVLETGVAVLANGAFPYSDTFSKMQIENYKRTNGVGSAMNFLDSLASDLSAFVTDTTSYSNIANETLTARQRAQRANDIFSNDFSTGGWDAWNALTQRDQNNPLGFTMQASQYLADRTTEQINETKDELNQNNGFLSQKECILWQTYDKDGKPLAEKTGGTLMAGVGGTAGIAETRMVTSKYNSGSGHDKCIDWKVTTPGSMIGEKLSTYINSPERQLEMAKGINDVLNSLFTKLIENFRGEGLFGLSQEGYFDQNSNYGAGGYGVNSLGYESPEYDDSSNINGQSPYDENFDLARDLGNTYIRDSFIKKGYWDAKNNKIVDDQGKEIGGELNVGLGVYNETIKGYGKNYYYVVKFAGNTKLFNEGYNGWAVGDRAFWDGEKWQNWKKGQTNPIDTKGIIQIQSDYIVAAKEILKVLPSIMPKKGELDYCIPGPNPNWTYNSRETGSLLIDYASTLGASYIPGKFFQRDASYVQVAEKTSQPYDDYVANITFGGSDLLFKKIKNEQIHKIGVKELISYPLNAGNLWSNIQDFIGFYKSDKKEDLVVQQVAKLQVDIQKGISGFISNYNTKVFENLYTKKMRPEFIEREDTGELIGNPSYLPTLDESYNLTKDMFTDDENIKEAIAEYSDSITEAQSNISRLNIIKSEVNKIIGAAQERQKVKLLEILKKEAEINKTAVLSPEEYKEKYKDCIAEENILYLDENDIMKDSDIEKERCYDNLDNDRDGLVDKKDPDCNGS